MHALRELQQCLVSDILSDRVPQSTHRIGARGLGPAERLEIYRNNCRIGFHDALLAGFPVLCALVGADYFRQLAREYQQLHPSPAGNLAHVGQELPAFLQQRHDGTQYDYFSHVARLEWAVQEILLAADHAPLDLARLALVSQADYGELRFKLHPAIRLAQSKWPIVTIWEAHQPGHDPTGIDLASGSEQAVVRRSGRSVEMFRLPPAEYAALQSFHQELSLSAALDEALGVDAGFDLPAALARWAHHQIIVN